MADTIKPFDAADYLRDEGDIAEYLTAAAEDGDPAAMAQALGVVARARSMTQLAKDTGLTREGLYKALAPGGNPSFATVAKVAGALGFPLTFRAHEVVPVDLDGPAAPRNTRRKRMIPA
jgi:probable addiction module antidote protein